MSELCKLCNKPLNGKPSWITWVVLDRKYHAPCKKKIEKQYQKDMKDLKPIMWPAAEKEVRRNDARRTG